MLSEEVYLVVMTTRQGRDHSLCSVPSPHTVVTVLLVQCHEETNVCEVDDDVSCQGKVASA